MCSSGWAAWEVCQMPPIMSLEFPTPKTKWSEFWWSVLHAAGVPKAPGMLASAHWVLGGGSAAKWKSCTGRDPEASKCESWTLNNKNKINLVFWKQSLILSCSGWASRQFWILATCMPAVAELHEKCARCLQSCLLNTWHPKQNELSFDRVFCMLQVFWRAPGTLASAHWVLGGGSTAKWKSCTGRDSEASKCESWTLNNQNKINLVFWEQSLILSCSGWASGQFWILATCMPAVAELQEKCARCLQSCLLNSWHLKQNELSFNGVFCMLQVFWRAPGTLANAHWVLGGGSTAKWKSCTGRDPEASKCESWNLNNKNKINLVFWEQSLILRLLWMGSWTILNPCTMCTSSGRAAREVCQMPPIMSLEHLTPETKWIKFQWSQLHAAGVLKGTRDTCKCPLSAGWGKHCKVEKLHGRDSEASKCESWTLNNKNKIN